MNILKMMEEELAANSSWSLDQQKRHLYLRSCELFTYDTRYYYANETLKNQIYNRFIDLTDVTDNRVICSSWASEVLAPFCQLIGVEVDIRGYMSNHQWIVFPFDNRYYSADACSGTDLTRVKMKNNTCDFQPHMENYNYEEYLRSIDININYIEEDYSRTLIMKQANNLKADFLRENNLGEFDAFNGDDLLLYKLDRVKQLWESYPTIKYFEDSEQSLYYLMGKYFDKQEHDKFSMYRLYDPFTLNWEFVNIYRIRLSNDYLYFALHEDEKKYAFNQVAENDIKNYVKSYKYREKIKWFE